MLEFMIFNNSLKNWAISLIIVLLFFAVGKLFSSVVVGIVKKLAKKTKTMLDDILIVVLEKPLIFALFILGFYFAMSYLDLGVRGDQIVANIVEVLIVLNVIWILVRFTDAMIEHYLMPLVKKSETTLDNHIMPFARKFVKAIIIIIGIIFLIARLGYDVTSLIAGLGIGGLAFALAAQPLLTNLFGGLSIITDKPFHIGDRVIVDQKHEGYVREIGMRSTIIETLNSTKIIIPNAIIASTAIENITREKARKVTNNLGITYDTSSEKITKAMQIIEKILKENKHVLHDDADCPIRVSFNQYKDSSLNLLVVFFVKDTANLQPALTEINLSIKKQFEKSKIEFAFPTQTVYVKK